MNALKYFNDTMKKIPIILSPYIIKLEFQLFNQISKWLDTWNGFNDTMKKIPIILSPYTFKRDSF